jgi:hypothetical protein
MKNCAYCGRENTDEATHCRECGIAEFVAPAPLSPPAQEGAEMVAETSEIEPDVSPDGESALCIFCLFPNLPDAAWCKRCGGSISYGSIVGPLDAARASGFMWRGALRGRPKRFVFVGVWLLFFPKLLLNLFALFWIFSGDVGGPVILVQFWLALASAAIASAMLYQVTRNYMTIPETRWDEAAA